ncbi:MAG: hypothetical protein WA655_01850 [Candidatus Korobacteraceae bacterium]
MDISIIQSAKNNGIVADGGSLTATFDAPVTAHNSVIVVASLPNGVISEDGDQVLLVGSDGYLNESPPTVALTVLAIGSPAGGPDYDGPVIRLWWLQDGTMDIAGLTSVFAQADVASYGEIKIAIYEVAGPNDHTTWDGYFDVSQDGLAVTGDTDSLSAIDSFHLSDQPPALFIQAIYDSSNTGTDFTSSAGYEITDNLNSESGSLGIFLVIFEDDPGTYGGDTITLSASSDAVTMAAAAIDAAPDGGPPPTPPPLRYKRVPLTLDFASTTFDQQSRLTMYEIYRCNGLDPLNPFLQSLFEGLADSPWEAPVTITLTTWSEAVDDDWNVLKSVLRGQRITIDPSVSTEWAGDYEVTETTYYPFQGDASQFSAAGGDRSTVIGSSTLATPADQNAGTMVLKLRTYDENVLSIEESQTPSYVNVPGPILGDPES